MDSVSGVGVIDKGVLILRALVAGPLDLAALQDATGLPRATAHRLAVALEQHHLVRRDALGRFCLGFELIRLGHAASELAIGLLLGAAFRFVLAAADVLAQSVSLSTALSSPSVFNPTVQSQEAPLALAISLLGVMVAFSVGAHRVAILWVMESFRALPIGAPVAFDASAGVFVDLAAEAMLVGVKQALPVVAVALVTQVTLALIARAAPALQLFNVGIAIIVAAGAAVLMASLRDIVAGLAQHFFTLSLRIEQLLGALAS